MKSRFSRLFLPVAATAVAVSAKMLTHQRDQITQLKEENAGLRKQIKAAHHEINILEVEFSTYRKGR